jgi:hypothetical protein
MAEVKQHITRQRISAPIGGIPRVSRKDFTSNIEDIATPILKGLVGMFQVAGNEAKAEFSFDLQSKINIWSLTKNKLEVSKLRDKALADAGPDGTDILTIEDMVSAQRNMKPEFTPHRVKNNDGSISTFDSNRNLLFRTDPPTSTKEGSIEGALGRRRQNLEANQKAFPRTAETLRIQLIDPHKPAANDPNPDPIQVTKYNNLMKATLQFSDSLANIRTTIIDLADAHLMEMGTDISELDPENRQEDNREKLFIVVGAASLKLEAMNRYSQAGLGGPAQIAPISVFNAMKSEIMNMFIDDEIRDAFGDLKPIREFMDTLEADIDQSAKDAFELGTDKTALVEATVQRDRFIIKRQLEDEIRRGTWSDEFKEAVLMSDALSALATTAKILIERNQPRAAGRIAEIIADQALSGQWDSAVRTINSFSTPNPEEPTAIFSAHKVLVDSLIGTFDAVRMRAGKKAVVGILSNKNIDWSRNPQAKEKMEDLLESVFSDENMLRANPITRGVKRLREAGNL